MRKKASYHVFERQQGSLRVFHESHAAQKAAGVPVVAQQRVEPATCQFICHAHEHTFEERRGLDYVASLFFACLPTVCVRARTTIRGASNWCLIFCMFAVLDSEPGSTSAYCRSCQRSRSLSRARSLSSLSILLRN